MALSIYSEPSRGKKPDFFSQHCKTITNFWRMLLHSRQDYEDWNSSLKDGRESGKRHTETLSALPSTSGPMFKTVAEFFSVSNCFNPSSEYPTLS